MNAELKQKWIAALRGGEYEQCEERLHDGENGFCCIGVYGDLVGIRREDLSRHASYISSSNNLRVQLKPLDDIGSTDVREYLARLNDDGKSFAEIADYIEANL